MSTVHHRIFVGSSVVLFCFVIGSVSVPITTPSGDPTGHNDLVKCLKTHEVVTGDVPFTIARRYGISPEKFQFMNPSMDVHDLESGQKLCVKTNSYPTETPAPETAVPPNEENDDSIDLEARLCGDFYLTYGYDPALGLPVSCKTDSVRSSFKKYFKKNKGLLGHRSRDAWRVNCANPHYCTLCNKTACPTLV